MNLSELCVRKPVLAIVLSLILVVVGILGYSRLDIRFFPEINIPMAWISTEYDGAAPEIIEDSITTPLENALSGVAGITSINSTSSNSWSSITVRFAPEGDLDEEVNQVRDKVSAERVDLPTDAEPSTISVGGTGQLLLSIGFTDPNKTSAEIRDYVDLNVYPKLRQVQGVGWVGVYGASGYAMRIWLNAEKMALLGVTVKDVEDALNANNIEFPGGVINNPQRDFTVVSNTQLTTPQQFGNIIIANKNGNLIRFNDVAVVELGSSSLQDSPMRINGKPGIDVEIVPLLTANPIDVAESLRETLSQMQSSLPEGMHAEINYDQSIFLNNSIHETFKAILEAIILVVMVVLLFLGSLRASSIAIVTIPLCIISVFGFMYLLGFTINTMTLLAIVLAIGLVVDDAIVMIENIHRHIEQGMAPFEAAIKGSKQITSAVIAMTITLAAVYAPIGFTQGFTAVIFKEFAFTLAASVIISGFIALTLSPMMCANILIPEQAESQFTHKTDQLFNRLSIFYQELLKKCLDKRIKVIGSLFVIALIGYGIYKLIPQEFLPNEDTGIIQVSITSPTGSSIAYTDSYMQQIEKLYAQFPEIESYYDMVNAGNATSFVILKPWGERKKSVQEVVNGLTPKLAGIPGVDAYPIVPSPVDDGVSNSIIVQLMTTGDYTDLIGPISKLTLLAKQFPGFVNVTNGLKFDDQQYAIAVNRDLAAELGVNIQDIADTSHVMLGGLHVTDFESNSVSYPVIIQMRREDLNHFEGISKLYVRNNNNKMVALSSLITLTPIIGQESLGHFNRLRSAQFSANLKPGYTVGEAVKFLQSVVPKVTTPDVSYAFDGVAAQFLQSNNNIFGILVLALVFIYLVLAAQFGSFIDPLIILLTVPLCIVGAIITLKLSNGTMNLYSEVGLVTLIGLVSKHGILITQFTNELRQGGMEMSQAIVRAASIRLRPILMTTSAMVFGALPLAFATGPGSIGREQIGWVIVGGLLFGTFFSLFIVPIAYSYLGKFKKI